MTFSTGDIAYESSNHLEESQAIRHTGTQVALCHQPQKCTAMITIGWALQEVQPIVLARQSM